MYKQIVGGLLMMTLLVAAVMRPSVNANIMIDAQLYKVQWSTLISVTPRLDRLSMFVAMFLSLCACKGLNTLLSGKTTPEMGKNAWRRGFSVASVTLYFITLCTNLILTAFFFISVLAKFQIEMLLALKIYLGFMFYFSQSFIANLPMYIFNYEVPEVDVSFAIET